MPALVTDKGKAVPAFYGTVKSGVAQQQSNLPVYAALILVGVALIFVLRNRSSGQTGSGPLLTLEPSNETDVSTMNNMTQAVLAIGAARMGGATTPMVSSPTQSFQSTQRSTSSTAG